MEQAAAEEKPYHHGSLRDAFLAEARRQLEAKGRTWSVRDVARAIGVSTGAPFRHFKDKREMEIELARIGARELQLLGRTSFTEWALKSPQLFGLLMSPGMLAALGPEFVQAFSGRMISAGAAVVQLALAGQYL